MTNPANCRHLNAVVTSYIQRSDGRISVKVECAECDSWISSNNNGFGPGWFLDAIHKYEMTKALDHE